MKSFIVLVFFAVSYATAEITDQMCLNDYFYNSIAKLSPEDSSACETIISKLKTEFNSSISNELDKIDPGRITDTICFYNSLEEFRIIDLFLKGLSYHLNHNTNKMRYQSYVKESVELVLGSFFANCVDKTVLALKMANETNFSYLQAGKDTPFALCRFKIAIEKGIIAPTDYDINLSLMNSTDCEEEIKSIMKGIKKSIKELSYSKFGMPAEAFGDCLAEEKTFVELVTLNLRMILPLAVETLKLSDQQKQENRENILESSKAVTRIIFPCFQKLLIAV